MVGYLMAQKPGYIVSSMEFDSLVSFTPYSYSNIRTGFPVQDQPKTPIGSLSVN